MIRLALSDVGWRDVRQDFAEQALFVKERRSWTHA
jgi:hypothetical protein